MAEEGGELVGYCGIVTVLDEGDIVKVAVSEKYQRRGVGHRLLEETIEKLREKGVRVFHLEVRKSNQAAVGLYEKLGFVRDGIRKNYYENPVEDAILMSKS